MGNKHQVLFQETFSLEASAAQLTCLPLIDGKPFFLVCVFPFEFVLLLRLYNKCMRRKYNFFFNRISRLQCKNSATDTCSGRLTERRLTYGNKFIIKCINVKGTLCQFSPCRLVLVSCRVENLERLLRVVFGHVTSRGR